MCRSLIRSNWIHRPTTISFERIWTSAQVWVVSVWRRNQKLAERSAQAVEDQLVSSTNWFVLVSTSCVVCQLCEWTVSCVSCGLCVAFGCLVVCNLERSAQAVEDQLLPVCPFPPARPGGNTFWKCKSVLLCRTVGWRRNPKTINQTSGCHQARCQATVIGALVRPWSPDRRTRRDSVTRNSVSHISGRPAQLAPPFASDVR